ncbi:MAG: HD domain-containing protein [Oscillospiraceae bacterium]|nr:HD domain-containing protein [Oscillospiraceae bacterium]
MTAPVRTDQPAAEAYMQECMADSAHDREHVYRILRYALTIAAQERGADRELLTVACLLHDIGRAEQFADPRVDHAHCGAEKARAWLRGNGYSDAFAQAVHACVLTHRYRSDAPPQSLEAKILFDADKLDVCGAMGVARTLFYIAQVAGPLYSLREDGTVSGGDGDREHSFFREYKYKLESVYGRFYTAHGTALAAKRKAAAQAFYEALLAEAEECYGSE